MVEVNLVCDTVLAVPGVSGIHAGVLGTAATYLPGRRIAGVAVRASGTEIHIALDATAAIAATAGEVHRAVAALGVPQPVRVHVEALVS